MIFKKLFFLIISAMMLSANSFACGPMPCSREFNLFLKSYNESYPLFNFYFNSNTFFYDDYYHEEPMNKLTANQVEWDKIFDNKFSADEIEEFLTRYEDEVLKTTNKEKRQMLLKKNKLASFLMKNKPEVLDYVLQLWKYQNYNKVYQDDWNYEGYVYRSDSSQLLNLINETQKIYNKTNDDWLKWRCAYHMVRMAHFHKYTFTAHQLLEQYVKPLPKNISVMEYWCMGLEGGILKKQHQEEKSFLLFARRFLHDTSSYRLVYIDLKHGRNVDIKKVLPFCENKEDRIAVLVAKSIITPSFNIENLKIANEHLGQDEKLLFIYQRELQKLEADYIKNALMAGSNKSWRSDYKFAQAEDFKSLQSFTKSKSRERGKYKIFWHNALAYLQIVNKEYAQAEEQLNKAIDASRKKGLSFLQSKMFYFLLESKRGNKINLPYLSEFTLDFYSDKSIAQDDMNSFAIFTYNFILPSLLQQGDTTEALVMAMLRDELIPEDNYYEGPNGRNDSIDIFNSNQFTRYYLNYGLDQEGLAKRVKEIMGTNEFTRSLKKRFTFYYSLDDYARYQLYKCVRTEDWQQAKALLPNCKNLERQTYSNPFGVRYDDQRTPNASDSALGLLTGHELFLIAEKLKEKSENYDADAAFKYGQLLYHMTYYGFNHQLMDDNHYEFRRYNTPVYFKQDHIETEEWYYLYHNLYNVSILPEALTYYDCSLPFKAFQQALKLEKNKEQKAVINFMLAKCYQKNAPIPKFKKNEEYGWLEPQMIEKGGKTYGAYSYHSFTNPYFKELITNYSKTKTYAEASTRCSYLAMYLN